MREKVEKFGYSKKGSKSLKDTQLYLNYLESWKEKMVFLCETNVS